MKVENEKARQFYIEEAVKSNWSTRQLERQINTFSYERLLSINGNYDVVLDTSKTSLILLLAVESFHAHLLPSSTIGDTPLAKIP